MRGTVDAFCDGSEIDTLKVRPVKALKKTRIARKRRNRQGSKVSEVRVRIARTQSLWEQVGG